MIIKCPKCGSENVTRLSADYDEFICDDCGHDFEDHDDELDDELDKGDKATEDNEDEYDDSLITDDDESDFEKDEEED